MISVLRCIGLHAHISASAAPSRLYHHAACYDISDIRLQDYHHPSPALDILKAQACDERLKLRLYAHIVCIAGIDNDPFLKWLFASFATVASCKKLLFLLLSFLCRFLLFFDDF